MRTAWQCVCRFADGSVEATEWMTQDGADQMESETEQANPGCVCEVTPIEQPPGRLAWGNV
jgi:hypothetical protein